MKRIAIIGCIASGKSTLSRNLGKILSYPVYHLDQLWLLPKNSDVPPPADTVTHKALHEKLNEIMSAENWIFEGGYLRSLEWNFDRCDTVIYLDLSPVRCLYHWFKRVTLGYNKVRPDMPSGWIDKVDLDCVKWIWNYNRDNREYNYSLLSQATHANVIILKSDREVARFLNQLSRQQAL